MQIIQSIQDRIYEIRKQKVMLDFDLARFLKWKPKELTNR